MIKNFRKPASSTGQRTVASLRTAWVLANNTKTIECNYPHVLHLGYVLHIATTALLRTVPRDIETIKRTQGEQIG